MCTMPIKKTVVIFKETATSDITLASNASKSYQQITRGHRLICGLAPLTHSARPLFLEEPEKVPLGEPHNKHQQTRC